MADWNHTVDLNVGLLTFSAMVTAFLLLGCISNSSRKRPFMKSFILLLISNFFMQLGEAGLWLMAESPGCVVIRKFCAVLSFGMGALLIGFFYYCLFYC